MVRNGKRQQEPKCLCGCGGKPYSRGLASACYYAARRAVMVTKETTWAELVASGLALPPFEQNESRRSPMTKKIKALASRAS